MSSWFAFFGRDFLAATLGWSAEERGHYITLLVAQWEQDGLPRDMKRLELISPGVSKCWDTLSPKFPISMGGKLRNVRLEHERHLAHERSERARQSASKRWAKASDPDPGQGELTGEVCVEQCSEQCDRICSDDAAMTMSYSPPTPPTPPPAFGEEIGQAWATLREAWNAAWGQKRQWRSTEPPPEAVARLSEPGWLEEAIRAIPEIKGGMCTGYKTPPTLRQFCGRDPERGSWVSRMLGGEFTDDARGRRREKVEAY
jgi:uncharacterized protein YdaU (DUF1376 family)